MWEKLKSKSWFKPVLYGVIGVLVGLVISILTANVAHLTGDVSFCSSCHAMTPMVEAYKENVHGGKNPYGFRAQCTDCHLPQDTVIGYYVVKAISGTKDLLGSMFGSYTKEFWEEKRKEKDSFVYSSGCLKCHRDFPKVGNPAAEGPHQIFLEGGGNKTCVSCHDDIGHTNLSAHLERYYSNKK